MYRSIRTATGSARSPRARRRGVALIPTMLIVSGLAIFTMALMTAVLTGKRTVNLHDDEYKLSSAVESVAMLAAEDIWSGFLAARAASSDGEPNSIATFREYLTVLGIEDFGPGGPPTALQGTNLLALVDIPHNGAQAEFNHVRVDTMRLVRRDEGDATQLWITVSASINRGSGIVNPVLNRAVQQVYTVEPEDFTGFEYAMLANNVNCIFCHTSVDSVDRYFGTDDEARYPRVKVGTLESLMLRNNVDDNPFTVNDKDADSYTAGTIYTRGVATDHEGVPIADWSTIEHFQGYAFDAGGDIIEDAWGDLTLSPFVPAGDPPGPGENLYLNYPARYEDMVDGHLPTHFPSPIPDDGGIDPLTGLPDATVARNRIVDDVEFDTLAANADGAVTAGILNLTGPSEVISAVPDFASAVFTGNVASLAERVDGNVIMTGTPANPITVDGTVAINGDLVINGYVKGEGTLIVRGNVYVPTDLRYLDGRVQLEGDVDGFPTGPRTFGVAQDGTRNALGLTAGGNMMIGDYLRPSSFRPDGTWEAPAWTDIVAGDAAGDWSFALAEMSLFNRGEWARTQPKLPGGPGEALLPPADWTAVNPRYDPDHVPRYYGHGPGDTIPIYNRGNVYFNAATGTWLGDEEVPISWDADKLTLVDPTDPSDPYLYEPDGTPKAIVQTITPRDGWITDEVYNASLAWFEVTRGSGPMQIDGLLYTNNAIFTLVPRLSTMKGRMILNGSIVASDLGILVPGFPDPSGALGNPSPMSSYAIGLQLNYDRRVKDMLNVPNPLEVQLKRTLWNPTANIGKEAPMP